MVCMAEDQQWAIECSRNGYRFGDHKERFQEPNGIYWPWIKSELITDFALIDFRFLDAKDTSRAFAER